MAIRPDWTVGKLNLSAGSKDFTTTGAAMVSAAVQAGDEIITASGDILIIEAITTDNAGTLYLPCPAGSAGIEQPLRIRFQPDGSRYSAAARELVHQLGSGNVYAFSQLLGDVDKVPYFTAPGVMGLIDLASLAGGGSGGWDALVGTLAGRDAYNGEPAGFRVLVADNGNGQAVIYEKTATGWSVPVPFTGPRGNDGQPNTLTVGTVSEGPQAHVSITGTAPNQLVNFVLQRGIKGDTGDVTPAALAAKVAAEAAAVQTALDVQATGQDRASVAADKVATAADRQATAADRVAIGLDKTATAADRIATGQDRAATNADALATAADKTAAAQSATTASTKASEASASATATAADRIATDQDRVATAADRVATGQDKATANQSAVNAAASEASVAADAQSAANSATGAQASKQDAQAAAMVSDERAAAATGAATTATTQAGIATSAATQTAADRTAVGNDKTAVADDRAAAQAASTVAIGASDRAEEWSNAPEGQEIEPGEYSAYHWSKVAETAAGGGVQMVNGKTGASITLDAADVGAATAAQGDKADSALQTLVEGTNISITMNGTSATINATSAPQVQTDWNAASGIAAILNKPVLASVATSGSYDDLQNKPTIPAAQVQSDWNATGGVASIANKPVIPSTPAEVGAAPVSIMTDVNANTTARHTHSNKAVLDSTTASFLIADKTKLNGVAAGATANTGTVTSVGITVPTGFAATAAITTSGTITISYAAGHQGYTTAEANKLAGIAVGADKTPALATVATSGSYNDLGNRPTIPAAQVSSNWNAVSGIAAILNKPVLGTAASQPIGAFATAAQGGKADTAVQPAGLTKAAVGLSNVDNTSDASKPVSAAQAASIGLKVDKAGGTGLGGYSAIPQAATGSFTLSVATGCYRTITKNGNISITAPTSSEGDSYLLVITNGATAGAVTFVGMTVFGAVIGNVAGKKYWVSIVRIGADCAAYVSEKP